MESDFPNGCTIDLSESECTLILKALEDRHVSLQGRETDIDAAEEMEAINRLEERIKEAE